MKNKKLAELLKEYAEAHNNSFLSQKVNYQKICETLSSLTETNQDYFNLVKGFINSDDADDMQKAIQFQALIDYLIFTKSERIKK